MKFSLGFFCHVPQILEVPFLGSRCLGIFRPNSAPRDRYLAIPRDGTFRISVLASLL